MMRIAKKVLKGLWRMTSPVRRPVMRRVDARVSALVASTVNARMMPEILHPLGVAIARLERIEASIAGADRAASAMVEEVDLVLNGISREVFRLQAQVESLHRMIAREIRDSGAGLSIVDESGDEAPVIRAASASERSRVG